MPKRILAGPLAEGRDKSDRAIIEEMLMVTGGKVGEAADRLQVTRRTLSRMMADLRIDWLSIRRDSAEVSTDSAA